MEKFFMRLTIFKLGLILALLGFSMSIGILTVGILAGAQQITVPAACYSLIFGMSGVWVLILGKKF